MLCALKLSIKIVVGSMPTSWGGFCQLSTSTCACECVIVGFSFREESESVESPKQRHRWSLFCSVRVREVYGFLLAAHNTSTLPSAKPICSYSCTTDWRSASIFHNDKPRRRFTFTRPEAVIDLVVIMSRSSKGPRSNQMEVKVEVEVQVLKERASGSVK